MDAVAELAVHGVIESSGRFTKDRSRLPQSLQAQFASRDGKPIFRLTENVYLSQGDIRQVQLAKGAVRAGIDVLLQRNGLSAVDVDRALIAGSFGYHLTVRSLIDIGLFPAEFDGKVHYVGNTSRTGAETLLTNAPSRESLLRVVQGVDAVELANDEGFSKTFVQALAFPQPPRASLEGCGVMAASLETSDPRIPVTIVTGFLGSGKTTLLSSLLRRTNRERIAVIINEFGEVSLDDAFVDAAGGRIVTLAGGCLCCAVAGDIVSTLVDLHEARSAQGFDRVVIETSGLADPGPIAMDLLDAPELTTLFRLDGVVCVVDALQGLRELERQRVSAKQVAMADRLVLTKTDIASPHAVARLRDRLAAINPSAPLVVANNGAVDIGWLLNPVLSPISWTSSDFGGHASSRS